MEFTIINFLIMGAFSLLVSYFLYTDIRHKAPRFEVASSVSRRFYGRLFGGISVGVFTAILVISLLFGYNTIFYRLPTPWAALVDGIILTTLLFILVVSMLVISFKRSSSSQ